MKRAIIVLVATSFLLTACGRSLTAAGTTYPTYGIANETTKRSAKVCYEISVGNVFWSVVLIETVIAPIYFIGFSLYNPVRLKHGPDDQCLFDG